MNILILNDTSKYHNGSLQVINVLKKYFEGHNVILTKKAKELYLKDIDFLVINGEGTMHDDAKKVKSMLNLATYAKRNLQIKTALVNSVWYNNSQHLTEQLKYFDYIGVREILSKKAIQDVIKKEVNVHLDLSFFVDVPWIKYDSKSIVTGNYYLDGKSRKLITGVGEDGYVDIFSEDWNTIVNKLRHSKVLVTGRHHEMYAACKARCPFIIIDGNTHKNSGLFETFNVKLKTIDRTSSLDDIKKAINNMNLEEYNKLFEKMSKESFPKILDF